MQENYDALKNLPIVLNLKKKNEKLKTENKNLKRLVSFLLTKCTLDTDSTEVTSCEQNECCPPKIIKKEPNITYSVEEKKPDWDYKAIKKKVQDGFQSYKNELTISVENEGYEPEENGDSPGEEEVEEIEVKKEVIEIDEEEVEEEEEEEVEVEVEVEEEEEEEVEVEEEEEEVMEIQIKGKSYYTSDEQNGKIYSIQEDDDVGPEVGHFVNGVAKFNK